MNKKLHAFIVWEGKSGLDNQREDSINSNLDCDSDYCETGELCPTCQQEALEQGIDRAMMEAEEGT